MAKKAISIILSDGTLNGVITVAIVNGSTELYAAPRESVSDLIKQAGNKYGVYLLLSDEMVYVGQASDLSRRIKSHISGKDWWTRAVVITTSDDSLNHSDIDYMETKLIAKASENNSLDCDNRNSGNTPKVNDFQRVKLDQHLEEAILMLEVVGVNVLSTDKEATKRKRRTNINITAQHSNYNLFVELQNAENEGKQKKKPTIDFLIANGYDLHNNLTYAGIQSKKGVFWANPYVSFLDDNWDIVLNNYQTREIIYIMVPAGTFHLRNKEGVGFFTREKNNTIAIDLNINPDTLVDTRSKYDFSDYVKARIKY